MKNIRLNVVLLEGMLVSEIIAAYAISTGFTEMIISPISEWMGLFFMLYTASIIGVCYRRYSDRNKQHYYESLFLIGFTGILVAITAVDVLSDSHIVLILVMVAFTAAVILAASLSAISSTDDSPAAVIDGSIAMMAMFMALALISITAINFQYSSEGENMVWLCCAFLIAVEALVVFLFEVINYLKKELRGKM